MLPSIIPSGTMPMGKLRGNYGEITGKLRGNCFISKEIVLLYLHTPPLMHYRGAVDHGG